MPAPPHFSGTMMPSRPSSPRRAKILRGNAWLRSISAACGSDLARREIARGVADQLLLGGELEVHASCCPSTAAARLSRNARMPSFWSCGREQSARTARARARAPAASGQLGGRARHRARLARGDRQRRAGAAISAATRAHARQQLGRLDDRVDEADAQRLVGVDDARPCRSARARAPRRRARDSRCVPPKPGMTPRLDLGLPELGACARRR